MKIKQMALMAGMAAALAATAGAANELTREDMAQQIVTKWSGYVNKTYPIGVDAWSVEMAPAFAEASMEELRAAASATDFEEMNSHILGLKPRDGTQALGDAAEDLVFVPVTPCRLFDTRLAGGVIAANTVRNFDINAVSSYTSQGGDASNCNIGNQGSFAAAVINLTVVTPNIAGYITAFPFSEPQPLASSLNYVAGDIVGNEVIVKLDQTNSISELSVYSFAQTHLVGDVVGYFAAPRATALDCVETVSAGTTISANSLGTLSSPACGAGYTLLAGSCSASSANAQLITTRTRVGDHFCAYSNEGATEVNATAYSRCCRVPGR
ncbi:hypothetical protein [Arenimonas alkanexedens]